MLFKPSIVASSLSLLVSASASPLGFHYHPTVQLFWQVAPDNTHTWGFYRGNAGEGSNPCTDTAIFTPSDAAPAGGEPPEAANGAWNFKSYNFHGNGTVGSSGENAWIDCGNCNLATVKCYKDNREMNVCADTDQNRGNMTRAKAISHCDFF
jgi:hypothetical protein